MEVEQHSCTYDGLAVTKTIQRQLGKSGPAGRGQILCIVHHTDKGAKHGPEVQFGEDGGVTQVIVWDNGLLQSCFPTNDCLAHSRSPSPMSGSGSPLAVSSGSPSPASSPVKMGKPFIPRRTVSQAEVAVENIESARLQQLWELRLQVCRKNQA